MILHRRVTKTRKENIKIDLPLQKIEWQTKYDVIVANTCYMYNVVSPYLTLILIDNHH